MRYEGSATAYFTSPLPEKKINNARESIHIPISEEIYALIDLTLFGSAKNAIVITERGLYWRDDYDKYPFFITWSKLSHFDIVETQGSHAKNIKFRDGLQVNLLGSGDLGKDDNQIVLQLLNDLKELSDDETEDLQLCGNLERLDSMLLWDVCNVYRGSASEYYLDPIPEVKVNNARDSLNIPSTEPLVALVDFTLFGSAKDAMVVTGVGLYWKNVTDKTPNYLSWDELRQCTPCEKSFINKSIIFNDESKMVFNDNLKMSLSGASTFAQKDNHVILELLNNIKILVSCVDEVSPVQVSMTSDSLENGLVECEFCRGKIKPYVTFCKHCGIKLRG